MVLGIAIGLVTALGHSLAYLAARWFTHDRGRPSGQLLAHGHTVLGLVGLAALPWAWPTGLGWERAWVLPFVALVLLFVVAQTCLILSLRFADASRVAPLISLKLAILGTISVLQGQPLSVSQWTAVLAAMVAAVVLSGVGGRMSGKAIGLVLLACFFYALCDTMIIWTIEAARQITGDRSPMGVPLWCAALAYVGIGGFAVLLLPIWGSRSPAAWRDALPYCAAWILAITTLYATFANLGVVFGAILQSFRGLISIGLGVVLAQLGWHHLEEKHGASVVLRRLAAAALMTAAVVMYVWQG